MMQIIILANINAIFTFQTNWMEHELRFMFLRIKILSYLLVVLCLFTIRDGHESVKRHFIPWIVGSDKT